MRHLCPVRLSRRAADDFEGLGRGRFDTIILNSVAQYFPSAEYLVKNRENLKPGVYVVPKDIDQEVGRLKLEAMGVKIDKLTAEQQKYQESWDQGT